MANKKKKMSKCDFNAGSCKSGGIYCLGVVGALVYYVMMATGFLNGVWGVIKALLWPAFLVFEALKFLGM